MDDKKKNAPRHVTAVKGEKSGKPKRYPTFVRVIAMILSGLLTVGGAVFMGGGIYAWQLLDKVTYEDEISQQYVESLPPESDEHILPPDGHEGSVDPGKDNGSVAGITLRGNTSDVTNILLLGSDGRTNFSGRSDTTMILSINTRKRTIQLISLLRDTWVTIPGRDWDGDGLDDYSKLNAAYAYGGFNLLSRTLEQNFRLKIDKYIAVNFVVFPEVVDALGGIDIELTAAECREIKFPDQTAGIKHLDGNYTLQYSRIRHLDSDFGRTNRHRKVVEKLLEKAKTMNIGTMISVMDKVLGRVQTNMTANELTGYIVKAPTYVQYDLNKDYYIPQPKSYKNLNINGGAGLWLLDRTASVKELHDRIYG